MSHFRNGFLIFCPSCLSVEVTTRPVWQHDRLKVSGAKWRMNTISGRAAGNELRLPLPVAGFYNAGSVQWQTKDLECYLDKGSTGVKLEEGRLPEKTGLVNRKVQGCG